ncbi:MAG: prepilin signal peptidase PulO-like peptidase [Acidimicrobiales bacterium]|nr:prepilin signal peptidase PulO-like peptidase [Acidimicrobiales bacterium]
MPTPLLLVFLALFGLVIGSFLNVVIVRVPAGESLLRPPSKCPLCQTPVAPRDNLPVISWLLLRGRCRGCSEPIPVGYPLVEVANAVLWVLAGHRFGAHWALVPYLALFSVLLALSVIDLELYILPNKITYPSILVSAAAVPMVALSVDHPADAMWGALIGGIGYAGFLLLTALLMGFILRKDAMGMGDVKLAVVLGIWVGFLHWYLVLFALIAASVIGLVAGAVVLAVRRASQPYPFGPWLALGAVTVILASRPILDVYQLQSYLGS